MADNLNILTVAGVLTISIAIIVLVGIAVLEGYSDNLRTPTDDIALNVVALNGSIAGNTSEIGTVGQFPFISAVSICVNESTATENLTFAGSDYTVVAGSTRVQGGILIPSAVGVAADFIAAGQEMNCTISYSGSSSGQVSADTFIAGLTIFGTFMAVVVLALVGKIIVGLFVKRKD